MGAYYMVLLSYDGGGPRGAHTFAAFVKTDGAPEATVAVHCISWLPPDGQVRLLRRPEAGVNWGLRETLQLATARGARIVAWGPYQIKEELFTRALQQIDRLNSGRVAFKPLDRRFRPEGATNCIHAVSDIVDGPLLDTNTSFGAKATAMLRSHFDPWIMDKGAQHPWLIEAVGLNRYAIDFVDGPAPPAAIGR